MKSEINWQTGIPKEKGTYLIVLRGEENVHVTSYTPDDPLDVDYFSICVTSWCKLTDIKPYSSK